MGVKVIELVFVDSVVGLLVPSGCYTVARSMGSGFVLLCEGAKVNIKQESHID